MNKRDLELLVALNASEIQNVNGGNPFSVIIRLPFFPHMELPVVRPVMKLF